MSAQYLSQNSPHPILTGYANGVLGEDMTNMAQLADVLAPRVGVIGRTFRYYTHDPKVQTQVLETKRPIGGAARRVGFGIDSVEKTLDTHGLDIAIDDIERRNAEGAPILMLEQRKLRTLSMTAARSHLQRVVNLVDAGLTAATAGSAGAWTTNTNDPIAEIDAEMKAVSDACGSLPNFVVMGLAAWVAFRGNAKVQARFSGVKRNVLSIADTEGLFLNPAAKVVIAETMYDAAALGLSVSLTRLIGSKCYLLSNSPTPQEQDASFAKTFYNLTTGLLTVGMPYRDPETRSDVYPCDWDSVALVNNSVAGKKFTVS